MVGQNTIAGNISLALCNPSDGARPIDSASAKRLAESIAEVGLMNPISVRRAIKVRDGREVDFYQVLAGMHRIAAFRQLGRETIPAFVFDADDLHAALMLIDENLCRNDLSPAERASQLAKRKRLYEALHPEAALGGAGRGRSKVRQTGEANEKPAARFTEATADATGSSERTVQRETARGEAIGEDALRRIARTSLDSGEELDALAKLPEDKREALIAQAEAGEKVTAKVEQKKFNRAVKEELLGLQQRSLPEKRYGVILADPPWRFEPYSRTSGMDRAPENHYPTQTTDDILKMPVENIAAEDCCLFLWATMPMLDVALSVIKAWGFTYKSNCVWVKDSCGTGYWFRQQHELLLLATRGHVPAPAPGTQFPSIVMAKAGAHSEKPTRVYRIIEAYFPSLPKIELFARKSGGWGWDVWGNEAPDQTADDGGQRTEESQAKAEEAVRPDEAQAEGMLPRGEVGFSSDAARAQALGSMPTHNVDTHEIPDFLKRDRENRAPGFAKAAPGEPMRETR